MVERSDGKTVRLYTRIGTELAPIIEIPGRAFVSPEYLVPTGRALSLDRGLVGRTFLANLPPGERDVVIDEFREDPNGVFTAREEHDLRADLESLAGRSAVTMHDESRFTFGQEMGIPSMPAVILPIRGKNGYAQAIVTVPAQPGTWSPDAIGAALPSLIDLSTRASIALGYCPDCHPTHDGPRGLGHFNCAKRQAAAMIRPAL
jgi:DNA-binding IclR family transcriptional regulator